MDAMIKVARIISRRFLIGVAIAFLASTHPAFSASPPFFFVGPRLLVVDYRFEATSSELLPVLSKEEVFPQLVSHIKSEFSRLDIDIPIALRQHFATYPAGVTEDTVLYVTIRIDLTKASLGGSGDELAVGAVSLTLSRSDTTTSSRVPYELFAVPLRTELVRSALITAAKKHLDKSLIDPIASFYKH